MIKISREILGLNVLTNFIEQKVVFKTLGKKIILDILKNSH